MSARTVLVATLLGACGSDPPPPVVAVPPADAPPVSVASAAPSSPAPAAAPSPGPTAASAATESSPSAVGSTRALAPKGPAPGCPLADPLCGPPVADSSSGAAAPATAGFGPGGGSGVDPLAPRPSAPSIRQGATVVNGRLPPEVIQRIVRQSFGRFRLCYEAALRGKPTLGGRLAVKFTIDKAGATVSPTIDASSDLADDSMRACVVRAFGSLSFPSPEGGTVTVVYPMIFAPPAP